ncbi:MAG: bifunctional adenosylcobinamide kinase/adenosylcobinamide-phosphate guanylyltransferase [Myxococcota bacterium]
MSSFSFHPYLKQLNSIPHGGASQLIARGLNPNALDDFSASLLPIDTPTCIREAIEKINIRSYPDPSCTRLRKVLAEKHNLTSEHILCGNGSVELIFAIVRACMSPKDKALIIGPTFGEYEGAVQSIGAEPIILCTTNIDDVLQGILSHQPKLVFLCNPNNPTGHLWDSSEIDRISKLVPLVLDEAYMGFLRPKRPSLWGKGKFVLRSLTKDHAMAGLRIGYAIAEPEVIKAVSHVIPPWSVSTAAEDAAITALQNPAPYQQAIHQLWMERTRLIGAIKKLGYNVVDGSAPFFLIDVGDATVFAEKMLSKGIVVRDCTSFGLSNYIRISPQTREAGNRLIAAFSDKPIPKEKQKSGRIHLVFGGARSGKSEFAERLVQSLGGSKVSYMATAQAFDDEMRHRIDTHQRRRDNKWQTIEEPLHASKALSKAEHPTVLIDCITLLATNWLLQYDSDSAMKEIQRLVEVSKSRRGDVVMVSNEIGLGVVPMNKLARGFRDDQGRINQRIAEIADSVTLVIAGLPLQLK